MNCLMAEFEYMFEGFNHIRGSPRCPWVQGLIENTNKKVGTGIGLWYVRKVAFDVACEVSCCAKYSIFAQKNTILRNIGCFAQMLLILSNKIWLLKFPCFHAKVLVSSQTWPWSMAR